MFQRLIIALGAGLTAGILFVIPTKGTLIATLLAMASPLPLMIAALGFATPVGFGAALIGTGVVSLLIHPVFGMVFAATVAVPCLCLSHTALRRSVSLVVLVLAFTGAAMALGFMGTAAVRFGSYQAALEATAQQVAPQLETLMQADLPKDISPRTFADWLVTLMPAVLAAWAVLSLGLNLWVAGRVVAISGLLAKPWVDVADTLRLPRWLAVVLILSGVATALLPQTPAIGASVVLASLVAAFALQGFGAVHAMSRGLRARRMLLITLYLVTLMLFPWPLILMGVLGLVDCLFQLPRRGPTSALIPTPPETTKL